MLLLEGLSYVYWTCAIIGSALFGFRLLLQFIGAGAAEMDMDADVLDPELGDASDMSFKVLSFQSLSAFIMMFGWVGLAMLYQSPLAPGWSILAAMMAGGVAIWVTARIFAWVVSLQSSGTLKVANAVGQEGEVYLRIPGEGSGQVQVTVQGSLRMFDARSADRSEIPTGARIRVEETAGSTLIVRRI